jgi:hypothetical protein
VVGSNGKAFVSGLLALLALAVPPPASAAPGADWVRLDAGRESSYSWSVEAGEEAAGSGAPSTCLRVAITHRHGRFSYDRSRFRDCGGAPGRSRPPLLVGGTHLGDAGEPRMTVFGILAPARARAVRVSVSDGAHSESVAVRLSTIQPSEGISGMRFAVVALRGAHCVERLATSGPSGRALWEGPPAEHGCE